MISTTDYLTLRDLASQVKLYPDNEKIWRDFMTECDRIQKIISDNYIYANDDELDRAELMSEAWDVIHCNATDLGGYSDPEEWFDSVILAEQWVSLGIWITQNYTPKQLSLEDDPILNPDMELPLI